MSILDRLSNFIGQSGTDEAYYEFVANEIESDFIRKGLWTKALAISDFDENKAKAAYIKMRVDYLKKNAPNLFELIDQLYVARDRLNKAQNEYNNVEEQSKRQSNKYMPLWKELEKLINASKAYFIPPQIRRFVQIFSFFAGAITVVFIYYKFGLLWKPNLANTVYAMAGIGGLIGITFSMLILYMISHLRVPLEMRYQIRRKRLEISDTLVNIQAWRNEFQPVREKRNEWQEYVINLESKLRELLS